MRPSAWWFGAAGAAAVLGIVIGVVILVRTFVGWMDRIDDFDRVSVPGDGAVTVDGTGGFSIYHEYLGADTDDLFSPDIFDVNLTAPDGSEVRLSAYDGRSTYGTPDHEGEGLFTFTAEEPGEYVLSADGDPATLAVGRGLGRGLVGGIVRGIVVGVLGVVAGIVIAIVVGVSRSRNRRRQLPGMPPPGAMPPPPGAMPPPGAYQPPPSDAPPGQPPPPTGQYPFGP